MSYHHKSEPSFLVDVYNLSQKFFEDSSVRCGAMVPTKNGGFPFEVTVATIVNHCLNMHSRSAGDNIPQNIPKEMYI